MVKSIIKRIIIGVSVALILGYIGSLTGFIIPVYAEESTPVQVQVPVGTSDDLKTKDGIYSNVFTTETENPLNVQYYIFGINPNDCVNNSCSLKASPYPDFYSFNFDEDVELPKSDYQDVYNYSGDMLFSFMQDLQIEDSSHYTFFYLMRKNNNSIHFNKDVNYSIGAINAIEDNTLSEIDISDYVFNLVSDFHVVYSQHDVQGQYMYLKIEFDTGDNFTNIFNDNDVFLSSIYINVNKPNYYVSSPISNFLTYPGDSVKSMNQYTYFIKNGRVNFTGVDCNTSSGVCSSGQSLGGNYDSVMTDDIDVLESIPVCSSNITSLSDVVCHIQRVFEMIFKFFTRFGNFLKDLYNDSFDVSIDSNNDMTPISNIINMPLTMLNRFINGFDNQCYTFNLGQLLGTTLFIHCIDVEHYLGSNLWGLIDIFVSIFMCFNIMSLILMFFDKWTSFEDTFQMMYYPKHANTTQDYVPKHGRD